MSRPDELVDEIVVDVTSRKVRITAGYARFYAPLSLLAFALTFFPYYKSRPNSTTPYGNLWQEVARTGHSYDIAAVILFLVLIALLVFAALERLGSAGLISAAAGALIIGSLLWTSPGFSVKPEHTDAGQFGIVICYLSAALLLSHALCLLILDRAEPGRRNGAR